MGTATGFPFGRYHYTDTLGPRVLGVPVVVPVAWSMTAWPALLAARRLTPSRKRRWLLATTALASWDLFLDPQMVDAGHWRWHDVRASLPGVPGVPLSNYAGWVLVAAGVTGALELLVPQERSRRVGDGPAHALLLWTWAGSALAHGVFWRRPAVAAWGGAAMGTVALPLARSLWRRR